MNASTRMMMIGVLAVVPALATASSEYAECLAEQNQLRSLMGSGGFRPTRGGSVPYLRYSIYDGYVGLLSYPRYSTSDAYADQLAVMVRACRQYKEKRGAARFRVVGMKSPAFDRAGNRAQDGDAE